MLLVQGRLKTVMSLKGRIATDDGENEKANGSRVSKTKGAGHWSDSHYSDKHSSDSHCSDNVHVLWVD